MNPYSEIITNEQFEWLKSHGVLSEGKIETKIRNKEIRAKFKKLKAEGHRTPEVMDMLCEEYPYIGWDSIKKIAYCKRDD